MKHWNPTMIDIILYVACGVILLIYFYWLSFVYISLINEMGPKINKKVRGKKGYKMPLRFISPLLNVLKY